MIAECPDCSTQEHVKPSQGKADFVKIVCDGCGKIYNVSLIRLESREVKHVDENR